MTVAELMAALAAFNFSDEVVIRLQGTVVGVSTVWQWKPNRVACIEPSEPLVVDDPLGTIVLQDTPRLELSTADKIRALGVGQSILLDKPQTSVSSYVTQIGRRLGRRYKTKMSADRTNTTVVRIS